MAMALRKNDKNGNADLASQKELRKKKRAKMCTRLKNDWQLYLLLLPAFLYLAVFHYAPFYGIQVAFRDYKAVKGITGSDWVGFANFERFFEAYYFKRLISNTFFLNLYGLLIGFLPPIILAILLNRIRSARGKRFIQTTIYIPHFISIAVMAGMMYCFLSPTNGLINELIKLCGGEAIDFLAEKEWFRPVYYISGVWQNAGFGTILYIACLAGIDPTLYEAAEIDGATVVQKILHIDVPSLKPIITMQLILNIGGMMSSNTDKVLILQNGGNIAISDIIGTYVYNTGLGSAEFSYTAAIGLFTNIINFILIVFANTISKKVSENSLF